MEHAVSDRLIDRIDEYLQRPSTDPHGDPIPSAEGEMRFNDEHSPCPLSTVSSGDSNRIGSASSIKEASFCEIPQRFQESRCKAGRSGQQQQSERRNCHDDGFERSGRLSLAIPAAGQILVEKSSTSLACVRLKTYSIVVRWNWGG